ncbi:MAG TPA: hypothetical protein VF848_10565, partial [Steroidobacteraceae bacterium]
GICMYLQPTACGSEEVTPFGKAATRLFAARDTFRYSVARWIVQRMPEKLKHMSRTQSKAEMREYP